MDLRAIVMSEKKSNHKRSHMWQPGWKGCLGENGCTGTCGCLPETLTTLLISYTPIQNKKFFLKHHILLRIYFILTTTKL